MDKEKVLRKYLENMGYTDTQETEVISDFSNMNPLLSKIAETWCDLGQYVDYKYEDISLFQLMEKYKMNYVAALLTMDWMMKEPLEAKKILEKGIM